MKPHIKIALQWGLIAGLAMAVLRTIVYLISPLSIGDWSNAFYIPLLFCMVWAAVTAKKEAGGELKYGKAFAVAFFVSAVAVAIYTFYSTALTKWIDPELGRKFYNITLAEQEDAWEKRGMSPSDQEAGKRVIDFFFRSIWAPIIIYAGQVFVGTIISLIIAAFVKKVRKQPLNENIA